MKNNKRKTEIVLKEKLEHIFKFILFDMNSHRQINI